MKLKTQSLDYTSGIASSLCAIHCVALPLVIGLLPALGLAWLGSHAFGVGMVLFTLVIGTWAIMKGYAEHKRCWPLAWFGFGIFALVFSEFGLHEHFETNIMHHYVSAFGGMLVAISHVVNRILCKQCSYCYHH